tara:strand:+ start:176 stop:613 length:438 start_codon:yes stop_codon:yes gene_type:complete
MTEHHFNKLRNMYLQANINAMIFDTTTCTISQKKSEISINITEKYFHALGAIHGSIYFKLLDDAAFFAASSVVEDVFLLTTSFTINITKPVSQGTIKAIGNIRFQSNNLIVAESSLYNEEGKEIAFGTGNFAKSKILLKDTQGYV